MDTNGFKKLIIENEEQIRTAVEEAYIRCITMKNSCVTLSSKGEIAVLPGDKEPEGEYIEIYHVTDSEVKNDLWNVKTYYPEEWVRDAILSGETYNIRKSTEKNILEWVNYDDALRNDDGKPNYGEIANRLPSIDRRASERVEPYEAKKIAKLNSGTIYNNIVDAKDIQIHNFNHFAAITAQSNNKPKVTTLFSDPISDSGSSELTKKAISAENEIRHESAIERKLNFIEKIAMKIADAIEKGVIGRNERSKDIER